MKLQIWLNGYKEIVFTGIHISSYGVDFNKEPLLLDLIRQVSSVNGIERIRLGSLEPRIITEEFVKAIATNPKICPHFHLSLQSGCDSVLKRMNRRYDTTEFLNKVELIRKYFSDAAITTDVIVGFPGETEEEFYITKTFLEKIQFFEMHIFPYSIRKGTAAAKMEGQIIEKEKKSRSHELLELEKIMSLQYRGKFVGKELQVLFEEEFEYQGKIYQIGHSKEYIKVAMYSDSKLENKILQCKIDGFLTDDILLVQENVCILN